MKILPKIIIYCLWIGFLIWFSNFSSPYFFDFVNFIKRRFFGDGISPSIDFAIGFIPWNFSFSMLIWLPFLFLKRRRLEAAREIIAGVIFFFFLLLINLFSIVIWWIFFSGAIGNLSEPSFSALEQYAIDDGWTAFQFRILWWTYLIVTTAFSALIAFSISQMKKKDIYKALSS